MPVLAQPTTATLIEQDNLEGGPDYQDVDPELLNAAQQEDDTDAKI